MAGGGKVRSSRAAGVTLRGRAQFVGRESELSRLREWLDAAERGDGGIVLLQGEAGIGKSRLLREVAECAHSGGWLVVSGRAYDGEGMPPYLPFADAMREIIRALPDDELQSLSLGAPEFAAIVPEMQAAPIKDGGGAQAGPGSDRYRMFEAISGFFIGAARSAEARGLLICLDDLHWADSATLLLLLHIARRAGDAPLLVLGTHRTVGVDAAHPLFAVLAELKRERLCETVAVGALSLEEAGALAASLNDRKPFAPRVLEALYERTNGNPFYIEEVVRHLQAEGHDPGDAKVACVDWGLPEGVRDVTRARVSRLTPGTRMLLQVAAVLGDEFNRFFPVAGRMLGVGTAELAGGIEEGVNAGVLTEDGEDYRFAHALVRDALLEEIGPPRRQGLHLAAAEAMEAVFAGDLAPCLSAIAMHYRSAGPFAPAGKAIEFSVRAGEAAERALAYEEAQLHWEAALALMIRHHSDDEEVVRLVERLGELMQVIGFDRYSKGIEYFEQAIALHERLRDPAGAAAMHARLGLLLGAGGENNDNVAALRHLHAAEPFLREGPPSDAQLSLYSGLGLVAVWMVNTQEGLAASGKAMEVALALGSEDRWVTNAVMHAYHLHALGRLNEGLELMARAWETADRLDNTYRAYVAAAWLAGRLLQLGDPRAAVAWYQREVDQPRQIHAPTRQGALWLGVAAAYTWCGEMEKCRKMLSEVGYFGGWPEVSLREGDWEAAAAVCARQREAAARKLNRSEQANLDFVLAHAARARGDVAAAADHLRHAFAAGVEGPNMLLEIRAASELAIVCAEIGHLAEAEPLMERIREIFAAGEDWRGLAGRAALAEGAVALAAGSAGAGSHFERAIEVFRRYSLPWDEAEAFEVWAHIGRRLHRGRSRRAFVSEKLDCARAIYVRIGAAQAWLDRLERLSREFAGPGVPSPAPALPDGLTPREAEVLGLLAAGASSKEIGERLVLSVRTVERHIANIYLKTGTHGRAQATTYAISHHLEGPEP